MHGPFIYSKRLTLTDAKVMGNHLGDAAFAGSATNIFFIAEGRDNSHNLTRRTLLVTEITRKGI